MSRLNLEEKARAQLVAIALGSLLIGIAFGPLVGCGVFFLAWALQPYAT